MKLEQSSGIYKIIDKRNKEFYIGSAKNFAIRKSDHFWKLKHNTHHNKYLQNIYNLYGSDNLDFKILFVCDVNRLLFFEQRCIDILKPKYNHCKMAGSCLGIHLTEEHKNKISKSHMGIKPIKPSYMLGVPKSEEIKEKISLALKGKPAHGRPKGIPMTEEQKKHQSETRKGIKYAPEIREHMRQAQWIRREKERCLKLTLGRRGLHGKEI
jgi:group I intron endonuclease